MTRTTRRALGALLAFGLLATACGDDDGGDASPTTEGAADDGGGDGEAGFTTLRVPTDHETIQAAVDAAEPGDLVLIEPGTYEEAVDVTTEDLTIRGLDRNEVVLDGGFELENGIRVLADGVAVENMTAQNYTTNGFFWTGVTGYRGSYLTAYRNGDYGVYAFDAVKGQLEHIYASGSPDAGLYIGQCYPCDAVITDVITEYNGLGYSGTNSGGNLLIVNSTWRFNRAGIVPNSGSYELCYPGRENTIVGNTVYANSQPDTPAIDVALLAMGNGILVAGSNRNVIERNLVFDHERTGIGLVPFPEEEANDVVPEQDQWDRPCAEVRDEPIADHAEEELAFVLWDPVGNQIRDNVVSGSGLADLAFGSLQPDLASLENCFAGNTAETTSPQQLEALSPCDGEPTATDWAAGALDLGALIASERPPSVPYDEAPTPEPPDQPNMPDAETAPPQPATNVPFEVDLHAITVPERPEGT
ncbi:MAG: right-handed parallel beta-helix repeat-containing protein [Actinomycetota bacterium]